MENLTKASTQPSNDIEEDAFETRASQAAKPRPKFLPPQKSSHKLSCVALYNVSRSHLPPAARLSDSTQAKSVDFGVGLPPGS